MTQHLYLISEKLIMSSRVFQPINSTMARRSHSELRTRYGIKTAGLARVQGLHDQIRAQRAKVPFRLAPAQALEVDGFSKVKRPDVQALARDLTQGNPNNHDRYSALMVRSSGVNETPGASPTLPVVIDQANLETSTDKLFEAIERVATSSPDMGVLCMPMLGAVMTLRDGRLAIGPQNVGLVAESHYVFGHDQMAFALAHGMGSGVVEQSGGVITITVERETGNVTYVGQKTQAATLSKRLNKFRAPDTFEGYRQQSARVFLIGEGHEVSVPLSQIGVYPERHLGLKLDGFEKLFYLVDQHFQTRPCPSYLLNQGRAARMGLLPLPTLSAFHNLIGTIQSLYGTLNTPFQIEGALVVGQDLPVILQLESLPLIGKKGEITLQNPHMESTHVIGFTKARLPLVVVGSKTRQDDIIKINARYPDGYAILYAMGENDRDLIDYFDKSATNCRVRLNLDEDQWGRHGMLEMRRKMDEDPDAGFVVAGQVQIGPHAPNKLQKAITKGRMTIFDGVEIQSDGETLAVKFAPAKVETNRTPKDDRPWWKKLIGWA